MSSFMAACHSVSRAHGLLAFFARINTDLQEARTMPGTKSIGCGIRMHVQLRTGKSKQRRSARK
jgi:hypothetical protein